MQANLIFRSEATRKSSETPFRAKRDEGAALRYIQHCSMAAGMPLLPSALPPKGEASRYGANIFLNLIALPAWGRLTAKRRSGAFVNRLLETLFPALFHTACALSAPSGHLPLEGKADDTRMASSHKPFGHRHHPYSAVLPYFMRRTTISHSSEIFKRNQPAICPAG